MAETIVTKSGILLWIAQHHTDTNYEISLRIERPHDFLLHWGLFYKTESNWRLPPKALWPKGSKAFDNAAVRTPFIDINGNGRIVFKLDRQSEIPFIAFALYSPNDNRWDNNNGKNYTIKVDKPSTGPSEWTKFGIAKSIIDKEMSKNSWSLMHRFNLCFDLLDKVQNGVEDISLIFVWLRFSAIRQLDWQRNYNTQPRELSHALNRLTTKLADRYVQESGERQMLRLIFTTMGKGGEGQRIRDEILNIMHRHHIKEVSGHFMEEWHQKLHNNTTPDDVVICEAYIAFLRDNGNIESFFKQLQAGGVTRERLTSYDRPIKSQPDFIPHLKNALIHDFESFLGVLKAVHSGTDLGAIIYASRYFMDAEMHALMDYIWKHRDSGPTNLCGLVHKIVIARRQLSHMLEKEQKTARDLLYLDIALDNYIRISIERNLHLNLSTDQLVLLICRVLQSLVLTNNDEELRQCLNHWNLLKNVPCFGRVWSIHAQAVLERLERVIGRFVDQYFLMLQPKADLLGSAFHCDPWTVTLFTEEIIRGQSAFILGMLIRHLNPILRKIAGLGNWQVISRGKGLGQVEVVNQLGSIQGKKFYRSTVIVTDKITGDEEIPQGITAIITRDLTDIVSHVAIRARNACILIATCFDPKTIEYLKSLNGQIVKLDVDAAGEVIIEKGTVEGDFPLARKFYVPTLTIQPFLTDFLIPENNFNEKNVGNKSNNLKRLRHTLPEWINVPRSAALPFGIFDRVLKDKKNKDIADDYQNLTRKAEKIHDNSRKEILKDLRKSVLALDCPAELVSSFYNGLKEAGIAPPENWNDAWERIKQVWASKWNERAYLSRKAQSIPHENLFMAVLIQEVMPAEYSFVIHTANPFSGDDNEIFAEVVLGLGETLVGNYPGRALSFTVKKGEDKPTLLSFPSKSVGRYGSGLIFRSDSNGEDLIGYAGAGLYDSFMLTPTREIVLDYSAESLIWDESFQKQFLATVSAIGAIIEKKMGSAQDIEGTYSKNQHYVVQTRPQVGAH